MVIQWGVQFETRDRSRYYPLMGIPIGALQKCSQRLTGIILTRTANDDQDTPPLNFGPIEVQTNGTYPHFFTAINKSERDRLIATVGIPQEHPGW
jgi:hypothetical protein